MRLAKLTVLTALAILSSFASAYSQTADDLREAQRLARVAQVAQQEGRFADAIKAFQTIAVVAKGSPKTMLDAKLAIGDLYMTLGKFEEAAATAREAISLDSNSAGAQNNLGEALGELKQFQAALEAFQRAVALDGNYFKVFSKIHPVYRFPHVSLLALGGAGLLFCFFSLADVISALVVIRRWLSTSPR